jgi:hypothetical protein
MAKKKADGRSKEGKRLKAQRAEKGERRARKRAMKPSDAAKKGKAAVDAEGGREPSLAELRSRKRGVEGVPGGGGAVGAALNKKVKAASKGKKSSLPSWQRPAR